MRVSAIADWTTCEAMALSDPRPEARVHVAAWVGTWAHAAMLGGETIEPAPARVRYDAITPGFRAAVFQAQAIAVEARRCLEQEGWTMLETEKEVKGEGVIGHLDVLAWHGETQRTAIIDLKTGRDIGTGWLQVGGYLSLWEDEHPIPDSAKNFHPHDGGILHVPRVAGEQGSRTGSWRYVTGVKLVQAWEDTKDRIDAVLGGAAALRSPGTHCAWCTAYCPVRIS